MENRIRPETTVFVDADNTLWDTDGVYAASQLALLRRIESYVGALAPNTDRLVYVRSLDQALAERHHEGLRYPPRFLVTALALSLSGTDQNRAVRLAWSGGAEANLLPPKVAEEFEREFVTALQEIPELRPGVKAGLVKLHKRGYPAIVLTESNRERVWAIVMKHGLQQWLGRAIEIKKEKPVFLRLLQTLRPPRHAFMVGDQLERDIRPASAAGLITIFFASPFRPKWESLAADVRPDYTITTFEEVPELVERVLQGGTENAIRSSEN